jgi:Phage tail protein
MLKVKQLQILDKSNRMLCIDGYRIENFPLQGGEEANIVSMKSWNQHGNTFINAFMESFEGELDFIIPIFNNTPEQILCRRKAITSVCNPLNGTVTLKVILNTNDVFLRDVTFISAPYFPIGFENRNKDWQKVKLVYEANDPFWYSENSIYETFQSTEPTFYLPFTMSEIDPLIFGNILPANTTINAGQVEAPVVIKINGNVVNPIIENLTTGEYIRFKNLTMGENDELIIDTTFGQRKVELNGVNVFHRLDFTSTFFNLIKGENIIDFRDETGSKQASVVFIYKNLYITI